MNIESLCAIGILTAAAAVAAPPTLTAVTFNKDVLPVLQKNCQTCHRPGEVAPMSLLTYQDARPYAKAMKTAVLQKKMPPWSADPKYGHFSNERKLTDQEINTLVAWADNGAVEGDAKDRPAPKQFSSGWQIKPDVIVEMPKDQDIPNRHHRQLLCHRQRQFHRRHMADRSGSSPQQPRRSASHARLDPAAGNQLAEGR